MVGSSKMNSIISCFIIPVTFWIIIFWRYISVRLTWQMTWNTYSCMGSISPLLAFLSTSSLFFWSSSSLRSSFWGKASLKQCVPPSNQTYLVSVDQNASMVSWSYSIAWQESSLYASLLWLSSIATRPLRIKSRLLPGRQFVTARPRSLWRWLVNTEWERVTVSDMPPHRVLRL